VFALGGDIPAVPRWGTVALGVLVLAGGTIVLARNRREPTVPRNRA